jgi:hypothetical protein
MSTWAEDLDRYLTIRRHLGYNLETAARVLRRFIAFAERERAECIRRSGGRTRTRGRGVWVWSVSLPSGSAASTRGMKYRPER